MASSQHSNPPTPAETSWLLSAAADRVTTRKRAPQNRFVLQPCFDTGLFDSECQILCCNGKNIGLFLHPLTFMYFFCRRFPVKGAKIVLGQNKSGHAN